MASSSPPSGQAVDPSQAQGAQIPLDSFTIPDFPLEARGLKALTLTSSIKVDEYQSILSRPFSIPSSIPYGIESLTLELFSLGYPPGFLKQLAERLPNLKSVVVYSQLFAGTTTQSQTDAVEFFKKLPKLRALHLLDVFAKPGFFEKAAEWLKYNTSDKPGEARRGLMFLEVNYTFTHDDQDFMSKIAASELPSLIGPGLISCSFNVAAPEDVAGSSNAQTAGPAEGIMAFNKDFTARLVGALTEENTYPRGLRALNTTLFTITPALLKQLLQKHKHVMVVNATLENGPGEACKKEIISALEQGANLEQVEVVAHPSIDFFIEVSRPELETDHDLPPQHSSSLVDCTVHARFIIQTDNGD